MQALEPGTIFASRFRVQALLGTGGMGSVYLAHHEVLDRRFALKVLLPDRLGDTESLRRFEREARAASRINHPNITSVVDFGHTDEGIPYLVMEYVEGPSLRSVVETEGPLPIGRCLRILRSIADGLRAAHDAGVLHRDLKPANVILANAGGHDETVKICDFGLAKIVDARKIDSVLSVNGLQLGTPEYMSPEHGLGQPLDRRSDVYSFGLLAHTLVCGQPPFTGPRARLIAHHVGKPAPSMAEASGRRDVPDALQAVVSRCLAKAPDDRYQDATTLLRDLQDVRV